MPPKADATAVLTAWTNGRKAVVELVAAPDGRAVIKKTYRPGFSARMFREFAIAEYLSRRLSLTPRVLAFKPWRRELFLQYLRGERVLEWVLARFGPRLDLAEFQSFHGLRPPHDVDPRVAEAFRQFRDSGADDVVRVKRAIRASYAALHATGIKHGSADPRNIIFDQGRIYIIDFDNSRPSLSPAATDDPDLDYWYGI